MNYILDTNVLLRDHRAFFVFQEHNVIIPMTVLLELDQFKNESGERGYAARQAGRQISDLIQNELPYLNTLNDGIPLQSTGAEYGYECSGRLYFTGQYDMPVNNDLVIINTCKNFATPDGGKDNILVTEDKIASVIAAVQGVRTERFKRDIVEDTEMLKGRPVIQMPASQIKEFREKKRLIVNQDTGSYNSFVYLEDEVNPNNRALAVKRNNICQPLIFENTHPFGVTPKNSGQKFFQEALMLSAKDAPLVIAEGPAGSAKTFYSLAVGLEKVMEQHEYRKILVCRPNVLMDEDIGYLPGTEQEKLDPFMRPIRDNLEVLLDQDRESSERELNDKLQELFERGYIVNQAVGYLRGRSIEKTWIIIDEAQNITPKQAMSIITRVGRDSKVILIGDPDQIDTPYLSKTSNGLRYAANIMKESQLCYYLKLTQSESVRSDLAKVASELFTIKRTSH